jgi:hypothetical protein
MLAIPESAVDQEQDPAAAAPPEIGLFRDIPRWIWVAFLSAWAMFFALMFLFFATDAAAIGTWDYDLQTDQLKWDERCKELFGLPPSASVDYQAFLDGLHPDDREKTDAAVQAALSPDGSAGYDVEYRPVGRADGVEVVPEPADEVVENPDAVAAFHERFRDVRADETGAASDEIELSLSHRATVRKESPSRKLEVFAVAHGEWHRAGSCARVRLSDNSGGNSRTVVVCWPLPSASRTACVAMLSDPLSVFTSVDLPTPDDPTSATVCPRPQ